MSWDFYSRPVLDVARGLLGCVLRLGECSGRIVETEAYHECEPACHAWAGLTSRTAPLFGAPGHAYVYRSYGIHELMNAVAEPEGVGAAVLIRALEPLQGLGLMGRRRGRSGQLELCSGPGKLSQALGIGLAHNRGDLRRGPVVIEMDEPIANVVASARIGISKAVELPWRFSVAGSPFVSRPRPRAQPLGA